MAEALEVLEPHRVIELVKIIANKVQKPDVIIGLSTGGFIVAAMLAKRLAVSSRNLIGLPVRKDDAGYYHLDNSFVGLKDGGRWRRKKVLVVDDMTNRGLILSAVGKLFQNAGADVTTCALVSYKYGILPTTVGEFCDGPPPEGFWEV